MSERLTDNTEDRPCPHCGVIVRRAKPVNLVDAFEVERLRALLTEVRAWMFDCGESGDPWEEKFVAQIDAALAESSAKP